MAVFEAATSMVKQVPDEHVIQQKSKVMKTRNCVPNRHGLGTT
jgi:hypothetical protein